MNIIKILSLSFFQILSPTFVYASGGGPLLLLFNSSVFIVGQILIIPIELIVYRNLVIISRREAFRDIVSANIFSTLVVAFGFSLIITFLGLLGSFLAGNIGQVISAIGTWAYESSKYNKLAVYMSLFWFVTLFVLTVYFEAWIYRRRWNKRGFYTNVPSVRLSWYTNTISHIVLFIGILVIWHEVI